MGTARRRKPNITALQRVVGVAEDNEWGQPFDKACSVLNHASDGQFPFGVLTTQRLVGVVDNGLWELNGTIATRAKIAEFQEVLTSMGFDTQGVDGVWGPKTQDAFYKARDSHHPYDPPENLYDQP